MSDKKLYSLSKQQVHKLLETLQAGGSEVWGAQKGQNEDTFFGRISKPEELARDYVNGFLGTKRYAFPQVEELFRFSREGKGLKLKPAEAGRPAVIWGIRPCDMSAIR